MPLWRLIPSNILHAFIKSKKQIVVNKILYLPKLITRSVKEKFKKLITNELLKFKKI